MSKTRIFHFAFVGQCLAFFLFSCQLTRPKPKSRVDGIISSQDTAREAAEQQKAVEIERDCMILTGTEDFVPEIVETREGFVAVTKMMKACTGLRSRKGYARDSAFMAMGVPCTGGGGVIERMRPFYAPKRIEFVMAVGCPMKPSLPSDIEPLVQIQLQLKPEAKALAYNPMSVIYWEIPELEGAGGGGPGAAPTLRNPEAVQKIWPLFLAGQELGVVVYGRENSWGSNRTLFRAVGTLRFQSPMNFVMNMTELARVELSDATALLNTCRSKFGPMACQDLEP